MKGKESERKVNRREWKRKIIGGKVRERWIGRE